MWKYTIAALNFATLPEANLLCSSCSSTFVETQGVGHPVNHFHLIILE